MNSDSGCSQRHDFLGKGVKVKICELHVEKGRLMNTRVARRDAPRLNDGDLLVEIERFGLSANNITYAFLGDRFGYWQFFPVDSAWGMVPVWGIGKVVETNCPQIPLGERLYGYFPMASHALLEAGGVNSARLVDMAQHRAGLSPVYNNYTRLSNDKGYDPSEDDVRLSLLPLYRTSFCIHDLLNDRSWCGADQVAIISASSKTAIGLAYALSDDQAGPIAIGLTSAKNEETLRRFDLYNDVFTYEGYAGLDRSRPTIIVDMSGNGELLSKLHRHLGQRMSLSLSVGFTHSVTEQPGDGIRERSEFFFAPTHIKKRATDWGPGEFEKRSLQFWRKATERSRRWLRIEHPKGPEDVERAFHRVRRNEVSPQVAVVGSLSWAGLL
jgi:Protein of unknown function (DUF2855)